MFFGRILFSIHNFMSKRRINEEAQSFCHRPEKLPQTLCSREAFSIDLSCQNDDNMQ